MTAFGILSYGAYVPRRRMSRERIVDAIGWAQPSLKGLAKGARAFGAWDEDPITMAVEAARVTLAQSDAKPPAALCFASTTAPFLDRQNAGVIATALDLAPETHVYDVSGSQRAATSGLMRAASTRAGATLIAAAEQRPTKAASMTEMLSGDAGAALLIGDGEPIAEIIGANAVYADLVDHYRTAASGEEYVIEERWFRDEGLTKLAPQAVAPVLEDAGLTSSDVQCLIAPTQNPSLANAVARSLDIGKDKLADSLFDQCGYAGAAHPLLQLTAVLDEAAPGQVILITAFGQGCDAILLRTTDAASKRPRSISAQLEGGCIEENYVKFLASRGAIDIDWGMRAERDNRTAQTVAYDKSRDIYGFVGGVCSVCGTPQFPKSRRCVNPDCGALDTQADYRFADLAATVKSYTEDWIAFTREPPLVYGNVSFEGGGNVFMEMCDFEPGDVAVGTPVAMKFRIKDIDAARGFHRYFWKAGPVPGGAGG
jgi:3-hydroxy-3-methylglutaryl CoA synthase